VNAANPMTVEEAVLCLRENPEYSDLVRDAYLGEDTLEAAERFRNSAEFADVLELVGPFLRGSTVLDLGSGNGIASYSLARSGAGSVFAVDPDASNDVGTGALRRLTADLPVFALVGVGEQIPLRDRSINLVYVRQVLHHASDLPRLLSECARVLKRGGALLACREHVVDDEDQLHEFLRDHPVHQLAGGEHAFRLQEYLQAIEGSGLRIRRIMQPWDTVINAFPAVRTIHELRQFPVALLKSKLGAVGSVISHLPGVQPLVLWRLNRSAPGRLYSFFAIKP
jgi:ubiquinone/menaquinone biosynthesis C-methylase UbiE